MYICCICHKSLDAPFKRQQICALENELEDSADSDSTDENSSSGEDEDDQVRVLLNPNNNESSSHSDDNERARARIRRTAESSRISQPKWKHVDKKFRDKKLYRTTNYSQAVATPCGHLFHFGCILTWMKHLERRGSKTTCAYCRHPIPTPLELNPVFPVFKEQHSDSQDSDSTSSNSQVKHPLKTSSSTEDGSCPKITEKRREIFLAGVFACSSVHFWLSASLVTLSLFLHNQHVRSALDIWSEDEDDFDSGSGFIPFGIYWTLLIFFCTAASLIFDCVELAHSFSKH